MLKHLLRTDRKKALHLRHEPFFIEPRQPLTQPSTEKRRSHPADRSSADRSSAKKPSADRMPAWSWQQAEEQKKHDHPRAKSARGGLRRTTLETLRQIRESGHTQ